MELCAIKIMNSPFPTRLCRRRKGPNQSTLMLTRSQLFLFLLCAVLSTACKKEPVSPSSTESTGVVRPVGQSKGAGVQQVIGTGGGAIFSSDSKVSIEIPAGALSGDVTIGIEPITRTLLDSNAAMGKTAYRFTPHGQQFQKPIKIRFKYDGDAFSTPGTAGIAYQDATGRWKGLGNVSLDAAAKTLSVMATHFSDWTTYESIFFTPKEDLALEVGTMAILRVQSVVSMALLEEDKKKEEYFLEEPYYLPAPVSFRLVNGPGNGNIVKVPTLPVATYTAPGRVPPNNPALVEAKVELKNHGNLLLLKNITIKESITPGVHLRVNGGEWVHFSSESFLDNESYYGTEGDFPFDKHAIYIRINGGKANGVGSWAWNDESGGDNNTTFEYIVKKPTPYTAYEHRYMNHEFDIWHMSPGYIRITQYKEDEVGDTWASGEFLIERSTPFIENFNGLPPWKKIDGYFKLLVD